MLSWLRRIVSPPGDVYGLDHAVLNVRLPPQTMWTNMGYWEVSLFVLFGYEMQKIHIQV